VSSLTLPEKKLITHVSRKGVRRTTARPDSRYYEVESDAGATVPPRSPQRNQHRAACEAIFCTWRDVPEVAVDASPPERPFSAIHVHLRHTAI
jgi:hypothetical protein